MQTTMTDICTSCENGTIVYETITDYFYHEGNEIPTLKVEGFCDNCGAYHVPDHIKEINIKYQQEALSKIKE
jgi:hypothetical protein